MRITILGTGNVATAFGNALIDAKHTISQVYGRQINSAKKLSVQWNAEPINDLKKLKPESDVFLFCLSDDALIKVSQQIQLMGILCVHTSGAMPLTILQNKFEHCGVLYPLQTISANRKIIFNNIPLCIEASNKLSENKIKSLAQSVSKSVHHISSQQRLQLHIAAVFANNFVNSLYADAGSLLEEQNLSFRLLHPLILETALKAIDANPLKVQTGPAVRDDKLTIKKHLKLLETNPELKKVYQLLTKQIQQQQKV